MKWKIMLEKQDFGEGRINGRIEGRGYQVVRL